MSSLFHVWLHIEEETAGGEFFDREDQTIDIPSITFDTLQEAVDFATKLVASHNG